MSHACHRFWTCYKTFTFYSLLTRCTIPCACHAKRHLNIQEWSETLVFFNVLTSKCASRHKDVRFFDIATSRSGPNLVCLVHFDLEMCFAPQRRALFPHLNFQKWSKREVLFVFSPANVLRATTACTFSTSQLPKVLQSWNVLCILTWKFASRHNGVHFFRISTSKSGPKTSKLPKMLQSWSVLGILTWKFASRHNGVHFFRISTSKSGPNVKCF